MIRILFGLLVIGAAVAFGWQSRVPTVAAVQAAGQPVEGTGQPVEGTGQPVEAGAVVWSRDLDASLERSEETGRPIFLLFQEIPG